MVRRGDTIAPVSIYGFHSHGCIRLHPDAAERLYGQVSLGETVIIVYEPALIARFADGVLGALGILGAGAVNKSKSK